MKKTDTVYLEDINEAIAAIERYVNAVDFATFASEEMRQDAVIRQLEIIGEAANKLSSVFSQINPDFPLRQTISMRNFLIHGYDEIDINVVWKTVQENIPSLKKSVEKILKKDKTARPIKEKIPIIKPKINWPLAHEPIFFCISLNKLTK